MYVDKIQNNTSLCVQTRVNCVHIYTLSINYIIMHVYIDTCIYSYQQRMLAGSYREISNQNVRVSQ